jgi:hypothetical protein
VITYLAVLIYSHKISGPLLRLKNYLLSMVNDTADKPLKFRSDDELRDICILINALQDKIRKK